jgi:hypothetical protein
MQHADATIARAAGSAVCTANCLSPRTAVKQSVVLSILQLIGQGYHMHISIDMQTEHQTPSMYGIAIQIVACHDIFSLHVRTEMA